MWTRREVKSYAKDFLRRHYLKAFLVCIIAWVLGGGITHNAGWEKTDKSNRNTIYDNDKVTIVLKNPITNFGLKKMGLSYKFKMAKGFIPIALFASLALGIFVGNVAEVGKVRYFLKGFKNDEADVGDMFSVFNSDEYFDVVKTQFFRGLYTFLWSLLFIIPGIIKSYEYRMVPYIISNESNIPWDDAIRRSRHMTDGHKWNMFVLDLSFIGWYILGALFFGIGGIFVIPYEEASFARLYNIISGSDDNEIDVEYTVGVDDSVDPNNKSYENKKGQIE